MLSFDIKTAHHMVSKQQALGNDVRWDGWDIVFFRPAPQAVYSQNGAWRNEQWGFDNRVVVDERGKWNVDPRNLKKSKKRTNVK